MPPSRGSGPPPSRLPPPLQPPIRRWTPQRKIQLLVAVTAGEISIQEACARYELGEAELASWLALFKEFGPRGLRVTQTQTLRGRKRRRRGVPPRVKG